MNLHERMVLVRITPGPHNRHEGPYIVKTAESRVDACILQAERDGDQVEIMEKVSSKCGKCGAPTAWERTRCGSCSNQ